ncbi:hypothetical protein SteCoe_38819 [Stentor coeruleus]|uniref:Uncharacterized protein n=1 Tax=Stentor coeruleus TaxID=5963 RepID=A0A1R2AL96_9CILI|nr:hypothetical protein SteCoe_38819 [Stentor coeruleus]
MKNHSDLAAIYNSLGIIYFDLNEKKKALELYEKCKNIWEKVLNSDHPDLATIYNNLGNLYINLNEKKKALELYEKCKNILEKVLNSDHPDLATIYNNLGGLYDDLNDKKKALELALKPKCSDVSRSGNILIKDKEESLPKESKKTSCNKYIISDTNSKIIYNL